MDTNMARYVRLAMDALEKDDPVEAVMEVKKLLALSLLPGKENETMRNTVSFIHTILCEKEHTNVSSNQYCGFYEDVKSNQNSSYYDKWQSIVHDFMIKFNLTIEDMPDLLTDATEIARSMSSNKALSSLVNSFIKARGVDRLAQSISDQSSDIVR